jgi:2-C-methyl-D-erythritol 4-phosphate cytidylyltransferase
MVLVVPQDFLLWARAFVRRSGFKKILSVVEGGAIRADSVARGLKAVPEKTDIILIHDAARALVTGDVVRRVIQGVRRTGVALAAWPVPDTIKEAGPRSLVRRTFPREGLWLAQTPQGFRWEIAQTLFRQAGTYTDDVQIAEKAGLPVEVVLGSVQNFKVTRPEDFKMCEAFLKNSLSPCGRGAPKGHCPEGR